MSENLLERSIAQKSATNESRVKSLLEQIGQHHVLRLDNKAEVGHSSRKKRPDFFVYDGMHKYARI